MRFAYLLLTDASSASEGKLNLLGVGARVLKPPTLPAPAFLTLAGAVEGTDGEAGEYDLVITLTDPDGAATQLVAGRTTLPAATDHAELLPNSVFTIAFTHVYEKPGIYRLTARFGDIAETYKFLVAPTRAPAATRKARKKGSSKERHQVKAAAGRG
jgi:hypothetical protein